MRYTCIPCNFSAPTRSRYERHLSTKKHARNTEVCETISVQEDLVEDIQNDDIQQLYDDNIVNTFDFSKNLVGQQLDRRVTHLFFVFCLEFSLFFETRIH